MQDSVLISDTTSINTHVSKKQPLFRASINWNVIQDVFETDFRIVLLSKN